MSSFLKLLKNSWNTRNSISNIVGLGDYRGKYYVEQSDAYFWMVYENAILAGERIHLAERPQHESVFRLDVDISVVNCAIVDEQDKQAEQVAINNLIYTKDQVQVLIMTCNKYLVDLGIDPKFCKCFLLEKDARSTFTIEGTVRKTRMKRGFHLHYPLLVTNTDDQLHVVKELVKNEKISSLFDATHCPIDPLSSRVSWLFYGACKPQEEKDGRVVHHEPYIISSAFDVDGNEYEAKILQDEICLKNPIDESLIDQNASIYKKMSIHPHGRVISSFNLPPVYVQVSEKTVVQNTKFEPLAPVEFYKVEKLLNMLSAKRVDEYSEWISVGMCLYTITRGSDEGFALFSEWSQKSDSFNEYVCKEKWASFHIGNLTMGTLRFYAKTDNPDEYGKFRNVCINESLETLNNSGDYSIAFKIMELLGNVVKYSHMNWYIFDNLWKMDEPNNIIVRGLIVNKIHPIFESYLNVETEKSKDKEAMIQMVYKKLQSVNSSHAIITALQIPALDAGFKYTLNQNLMLVGFPNGVYDLEKCAFRQGVPEDCISYSIKCEYIEYDVNGPEMAIVDLNLRKFFPDNERLQYVLNILCQMFVGNLYTKNLFFWTGSGDNGKSALESWIENMIGYDYMLKLSTTVLSSPKNAPNQASPDLVSIEGKRMTMFDEPDNSESLSNGTLKNLTGRDSLNPRDLYQKGTDKRAFVPISLYTIVCNKKPEVKNPDDLAMVDRFRIIDFVSKFTSPEDAPATLEEQFAKRIFPKDPAFVYNMKSYCSPLCFYLLQHWKRVKDKIKHMDTPECVRIATEQYKKSNNRLVKFWKSWVFANENSDISLMALYSRYTAELIKNPSLTIPSPVEFSENLKKMQIIVDEHGMINGYSLR
jgi:phage/plasmid-associated DNA primase